MSHVSKIDIKPTDLAALKLAAKRLGGELVEQKTYKWYGTSVGDYPLPEGFTAKDLGKCDFAIKFPDAKYEVGVVKRKDGKPGYELLWDFWSGGFGLEKAIGKDGNKLKQSYGVEAAKRAAMLKGWSCFEQKTPTGIKLTINKK